MQSGGMIETIGFTNVGSISRATFESHLKALRDRDTSPRTQALHRSAYLACLKYMNFVGLIEAVPEVREVKQKKSEQLPIVPLTTLEVGRLLEHATTPMHRGLFGLCVGVGLRPSEALRVRWEDICFKTATLKVRGTKTDASDASIPLTDLALREMIKWKDVVLFHGSTSQEVRRDKKAKTLFVCLSDRNSTTANSTSFFATQFALRTGGDVLHAQESRPNPTPKSPKVGGDQEGRCEGIQGLQSERKGQG
jgi:integrase